MLTMGRSLLVCLCLGLAVPAAAQWKVFTETRTVQAKNKPFDCTYQLRYKGSLTVDNKKSKVTCKPDSKGKFGTVSETFAIRDKSVEVVHEIRKGKDKIKEIKVSKLTTTSAPTTAAPTTAAPTLAPSPTGTGSGSGEVPVPLPGGTGSGSGGSGNGGTGGTGGTGGAGGEEMSCSCKLPLLDGSSESGRKLNSAVSRVVERKKRSTRDARGGGHHHYPSNSYSSGSALGNLFQVVLLAGLAALAAYGKLTLAQNIGTLLGRSLNDDLQEQDEAHKRILSILSQASDRQLGGLLGGLGGLLGGGGGGVEVPNPNEQVEQLVEQAIQNQINEFLTGGGMESVLTSLLESEDMGEMLGGMVNNMMGNMDTESMVNSLSEQLGYDLGQIASMLDQALSGADLGTMLGEIMGQMPEGQMESLMEGVNLNSMEMMMNCECQKKN